MESAQIYPVLTVPTDYPVMSVVEVKTAAGWQQGVVLSSELCIGSGLEFSVELSNGHIGQYSPENIRKVAQCRSAADACIKTINELAEKDNDPVKPKHYTRFVIDPIEYCNKNGIGFCAGNVIKYVSRYDAKGGIEDLDKAEEYLRRMRKHYAEKLGESVPGTR